MRSNADGAPMRGSADSTKRAESDSTRADSGGFTLLEVLMGLSILTVAFLGAMSGLFFSMRLNDTNRETSRAVQMGRAVLEEVRSYSFDRIYVEFNANPEDDPNGPGTAHGSKFTVSQVASAKDGGSDEDPVATILFPAAADGTLREDLKLPEFQLPMDLNGDGAVTSGDRSADYLVLPLVVRVEWTGSDGGRVIEFFTMLSE